VNGDNFKEKVGNMEGRTEKSGDVGRRTGSNIGGQEEDALGDEGCIKR